MTECGSSAHGHDYFLLTKDIEDRTPDPKGHSAVVGPLMHNRGYKEFGEGYLTEIFTDATIDFLKRHREDPFFVTLSYKTVTHLQRLDKRSTTTARVGGL